MRDEAEHDLPSTHAVDRDAEMRRQIRKALKDADEGRAVIFIGGKPVPPRKPTGHIPRSK